MKTQKMNSVKKASWLLVVAIVLTVVGCNSNEESTANESMKVDAAESKIEPPEMDIHAAAFMGNFEAVQQHIEAGTNLNAKKSTGGSSPLMTATVFGKTDIAVLLIEAGADINITNNDGSTALHTAAFFCRTEIVEALLAKKADKTVKNKSGSTAFETVAGPFSEVKPVYDFFGQQLASMGFKLDYAHLETTRPIIAEMLK